MDAYILDANGEPQKVDQITAARWVNDNGRSVRGLARTTVEDTLVSTVFLVYDHQWMRDGPPLLWETMVFDMPAGTDEICERYSTRAEAFAGHERIVELVRSALGNHKPQTATE